MKIKWSIFKLKGIWKSPAGTVFCLRGDGQMRCIRQEVSLIIELHEDPVTESVASVYNITQSMTWTICKQSWLSIVFSIMVQFELVGSWSGDRSAASEFNSVDVGQGSNFTLTPERIYPLGHFASIVGLVRPGST